MCKWASTASAIFYKIPSFAECERVCSHPAVKWCITVHAHLSCKVDACDSSKRWWVCPCSMAHCSYVAISLGSRSMTRILSATDLFVQIAQLRTGRSWEAKGLAVECDEATPLCGVSGAALDIEVVLQRCAHLPSSLLGSAPLMRCKNQCSTRSHL